MTKNILDGSKRSNHSNAYFTGFYKNKNIDNQTIHVYDQQLESIHRNCPKNLIAIVPVFKNKYKSISNDNEDVDISYKTDLENERLSVLLKNSLEKDMFLQYTSKGIHKDDLVFNINNYSVKKFGSQGQQKSFLIQ